MGDQAHDFAERKIAEFQAEVRETYQQAQADAQEALSRFLERFEKEDERRRAKVKAGELSEADYKAWRKGKILRSRQLSSTLDQVSRAMTEANQVAVAALAGRLPEVYAENANYAAFQVCEASGLDLAFSLVDAPTVQHMLTAGEALFSVPALDVAKDVAWNRRLMASQLTQGVLLGESIPKMARRVKSVTGSNIAAATRTARTAVTGAENAGRVSSYERAKGMGIKLKQEWVAALDNRTRHSHRKLDGTKVEVGGTFPNGCRFPGDPTARYAEICNCRCTLVAAVEGFETDDAKRASKIPKGMTYEEWKAGGSGKKKAGGVRETERGITSKRHASKGEKVDMDYVRSNAYAEKFSKLDMPKDAVASIRKAATAMLTHRSETDLEDLALVSKSEGRIVARSAASSIPFETARNAEIEKAISTYPRGDLVSIHNHPLSIPPTGSDFASAGYNGYGGGVVALHNGEVFYYEVGDMPFRSLFFDGKVEELVKMGTGRYEAVIEVMRRYERSHGIKWKKL